MGRGTSGLSNSVSHPAADGLLEARLTLLGDFDLTIEGKSVLLPANTQRPVAFLAMHDHGSLRAHVAGVLWPDVTERRAAGSLRSALWKLNLEGYDVIEATATHLQLSPSITVDLRERTDLAHRILERPTEITGPVNEVSLSSDLLPDWDEDWLVADRDSFHQLRAGALERLCECLTGVGALGRAARAGLAAVAAEPFRESAHRAFIKSLLAGGNKGLAVQHYRAFRRLLRDELELDPSPEMQDLVQRSSAVDRPLTFR